MLATRPAVRCERRGAVMVTRAKKEAMWEKKEG